METSDWMETREGPQRIFLDNLLSINRILDLEYHLSEPYLATYKNIPNLNMWKFYF